MSPPHLNLLRPNAPLATMLKLMSTATPTASSAPAVSATKTAAAAATTSAASLSLSSSRKLALQLHVGRRHHSTDAACSQGLDSLVAERQRLDVRSLSPSPSCWTRRSGHAPFAARSMSSASGSKASEHLGDESACPKATEHHPFQAASRSSNIAAWNLAGGACATSVPSASSSSSSSTPSSSSSSASPAAARPSAASSPSPSTSSSRPQLLRSGPFPPGFGVSAGGPFLLGGAQLQSARSCSNPVRISEERLEAFLSAEAAILAQQKLTPITLSDVLAVSTLSKAAAYLHKELPVRFAQRLAQIEGIPGWQHCPDLEEVHELYKWSFRDLRLSDPFDDGCTSVAALDSYTDTIARLKRRMQPVIPLLMEAMQSLRHTFRSDGEIDEWLDRFLLSRIGTEMLTSQYMACSAHPSGNWSGGVGVVRYKVCPASLVEQAAERVQILCRDHYKTITRVRIDVVTVEDEEGPLTFTYIPQYFLYMVLELLKNSARATIDAAGQDQEKIEQLPIVVTISGNAQQVAVRIHDLAGGIPHEVLPRVWSYMFSTSPSRSQSFEHRGTPLTGYGVGLPLCRLYAHYLGGSLNLMSMPGHGTIAYLHLHRLDTKGATTRPSAEAGTTRPHDVEDDEDDEVVEEEEDPRDSTTGASMKVDNRSVVAPTSWDSTTGLRQRE